MTDTTSDYSSVAEPVNSGVSEQAHPPDAYKDVAEPIPEQAAPDDGFHPFSTEEKRQKWNTSTPLQRLGILISHPWDKYVASVDQGFDGVKIPRVEAPTGDGVANRVEQVGAALDNTVTGFASGLLSPGSAAAIVSPASVLYSVPRFLVGGIQHLAHIGDQPTLQGKIESALAGTLMVAGSVHGGMKTGATLKADVATAASRLRTEAQQAETPGAETALNHAADAVENIPNEVPEKAVDYSQQADPLPENARVVSDPETGKIVQIEIPGEPGGEPRFPGSSEPAAKETFGSAEEARAAGYHVPEDYKDIAEPLSDAEEKDYHRYNEIQSQLANATDYDSPEFQALWKESEDIKNRNPQAPGMPPVAAHTGELDFSEAGLQKAAAELPPEAQTEPSNNANPEGVSPKVSKSTDYGIAARVSDVRSEAGHITPIEPGEGISAEESVQHGRDLIETGRDPQAALDEFNKTKKISSDDIALWRAHGEDLAQAADAAYKKFGKDSPEYEAAKKADSDWLAAIKPTQTEWHKAGQAMQGQTEIDTGSFHGLHRAYREATGKDFSPKQAAEAESTANRVQNAVKEEEQAKKQALDTISEKIAPPKPGKSRVSKFLSEQAQAARERIKARQAEGRLFSNPIDPQAAADAAIVGAEYIAKGIVEIGAWSAEMIKEFGDKIKPFLDDIFKRANDVASREDRTSVQNIYKMAKDYIEKGETDLSDIRHKIATDLGIPVEEVTKKLAEPKAVRAVTDEMYAKMAKRRAVVAEAKNWLKNQQTPGYERFAKTIPSAFFKVATAGHGTVWVVTHTSPKIFLPQEWAQLWPNYFKAFKLMGVHDAGAYHELRMQDLERDPNYITARRAGLENDPTQMVDEYQKAWLNGWFHKIGLIGNRGFDGLKLLRQDLFNKAWNELPDSMKTKDYAAILADGINHSSGATKIRFPEWMRWTFFAPRLVAAHWQWLLTDPAKAAKILVPSYWKKATQAERDFAIRQLKEKATVAGIYASLLAANQGLLTATGSNQQINYTNPTKSDFLDFKIAGHKLGVMTPIIGIVRLLASMLNSATGHPANFQKRQSTSQQLEGEVMNYARSKLSPFGGTAADVVTGADFQDRPLPRWMTFQDKKVPASLHKQGIHTPYSTGEYLAGKLPIPASEAIREVWKKQGMDESTMEHWLSAIMSGVTSGTTGARLSHDTNPKGK